MARVRKNPVGHLEGAEELNQALRSVGARAGGILLRNAAEKGSSIIRDEAALRAPRDSGWLSDAIGVQLRRWQVGRAVFDIGIGRHPSPDGRGWPGPFYGIFQEFGTEHIPAQPFLRPAFDAKHQEAIDVVADELREALSDVLD